MTAFKEALLNDLDDKLGAHPMDYFFSSNPGPGDEDDDDDDSLIPIERDDDDDLLGDDDDDDLLGDDEGALPERRRFRDRWHQRRSHVHEQHHDLPGSQQHWSFQG